MSDEKIRRSLRDDTRKKTSAHRRNAVQDIDAREASRSADAMSADGTALRTPREDAAAVSMRTGDEDRSEADRSDAERLRRTMDRSGAYRAPESPGAARRRLHDDKERQKRRVRFQRLYQDLMEEVGAQAEQLGYDTARPVLEVPPVPSGYHEVEAHEVVPGRAMVRILFDTTQNLHVYQVLEPRLSLNEHEILAFLRDTLVRTLDGRAAISDQDARDVLVEAMREAIVDHRIMIDEVGIERLEYYIVRDLLGFGRIDVLMRDPMIEDISCDGPLVPVYLFHRSHESIRTDIVFEEELELDSYVIRLAQRSGKHISIAEPLLDATLPDGSRLQATLGREVTTRGSSFTVRKFRDDPLTPPDLIRYKTMDARMAAYFWFVMENGHSFLLAGGTASGKTTSLNAICQFIPPEKKIVSIEDTREINLVHENWIAGVTRTGFGGDQVGGRPAGTIDMYRLLEAALRQRPEYLLVGEVRGAEALTLFQAMATGHAVYSTMHADSASSAVYRLENKPIEVPRMMLQTLDVIILQAQTRIGRRLVRRIKEVVEVVGFDPETRELLTNTVFEWDPERDAFEYLGRSYIFERILESKNLPEDELEQEWARRALLLEHLEREGIRTHVDVGRIVSRYYRDSAAVLADLRLEQSHAA